MKKIREKGFTLVELLAVVTILGAIALIITPKIKDTIDDSKMKAFEDTAYGIIRAGNLYYSRKEMMGEALEETTFSFPDNVEELNLQGKLPTSGSIIINENGDISLAISNDKYCITKGYNDKNITVTKDVEKCKNPDVPKTVGEIGTTTATCVTSGTCTQAEINAGIKVNVKVNNEKSYDFYVIADDGEKVTLIMDRNLGEQVAWYKDDDDTTNTEQNNLGPITVLNYLNSQINSEIETWSNIAPIKDYEYINNENGTTNIYGYQKLKITNGTGILTSQDGTITTTLTGTMRARLLTYEEASSLKTSNSNKVPKWLYENLSVSYPSSLPYGFWFLTSSTFPMESYRISYPGDMMGHTLYSIEDSGARPVIELSK